MDLKKKAHKISFSVRLIDPMQKYWAQNDVSGNLLEIVEQKLEFLWFQNFLGTCQVRKFLRKFLPIQMVKEIFDLAVVKQNLRIDEVHFHRKF